MNIHEYFKQALEKQVIDHSLRVQRYGKYGQLIFYIHPSSTSSDTVDFIVNPDGSMSFVHGPTGKQ